jgi:hypothetical protein
MQNRQSGRRRRGGSGNNPRPMGMAQGNQNANRLEVRVRGNAHQLLEKYKQLARDAHQAGDRVATEYYLQHADHYFRVLNDTRVRQDEMRARRGPFDQFGDDAGAGDQEDGEAEARGSAETRRPAREERPRRWQDRRGDMGDDDRAQRLPDDEPVRDNRSRVSGEMAEVRLSDGEAALVAFGGVPSRGDGSEERTHGDDGDPEPKPRRRGRPRKVVAEPVED